MKCHHQIKNLVLVFLIIFSFSSNIYSQKQLKSYNVDVRIWAEKKRYYTREPIIVYIRIENKGEKGPRIPNSDLGEYFVVEDSKGRQFHPGMVSDFFTLPPMKKGQVIEDKFDISVLFGRRKGAVGYFLPPETYKFYFKWEERYARPIISNEIEITISDPKGDELQALNLLTKGIKKRFKKEDPDEYFDELVDRYPKSVYAEKALYLKILCHEYKKGMIHKERSMEASKKLLENYPESRYKISAFGAIRKYYKAVNDLDGYKKYMNYLNSQTKSEFIKKKTENILKNLGKYKTWDEIPKPVKKVEKEKGREFPPPPPD